MISVLISLLQTLRGLAQSRAVLHLEVLALRHQLQVLQRARPWRVRLATADRWLWVWLARVWTAWRTALVIVKPETVIAWHRYPFRLVWTCKSRRRTRCVANASLPRQGCSRPAAGAATDGRRGRSSPASRRSAPSLRTSRRLKIPLAPRTELPFGLAGRGASPPGAGRPQSWRAEGVREFSGPHVGVSNRAPSKASSVPMEFLAGTGIERVVPGIIPHHSQTMLARC